MAEILTRGRALTIRLLSCGAAALAMAAPAAGSSVEGEQEAQAQPADKPAEKPSAQAADQAPIIVTARRRAEDVQSVPMTVNALPEEQLKRRGIGDVQDVVRAVPGVSTSDVMSGQAKFAIRGISSSSADPTVGVYLDDVAIATTLGDFTGAADPRVFDINRVEVLKGPQGTLYGASAMGGVIRFISNRPNVRETSVLATTEFALTEKGDPTYEGNAVFNLPISSSVAVRLGVLYRNAGGFIDRVPAGLGFRPNLAEVDEATGLAVGLGPDGRPLATDKDGAVTSVPPAPFTSINTVSKKNVNDLRTLLLKGSVLFQPTDTLTLIPAIIYQRNKRDGLDRFLLSLPRFQTSNAVPESSDDSFLLMTFTGEKQFGRVNLTSITGYLKRDQSLQTDFTAFVGSLVPPFSILTTTSHNNNNYRDFSQEIRFSSVGPSRFTWVAGAYYARERLRPDGFVITDGASDFGIPPLDGVPDVVFSNESKTLVKQIAVFGDASYEILDKLTASAGLRYYNYDISIDRRADGLFNGGLSIDSLDGKDHGVNPKVTLSYAPSKDHLIYATASKGFRVGGPNATIPADLCAADLARLGLTDAPAAYGSDNLWNYELGTKNRFAGDAVQLNATVFHFDWRKIQQGVRLPGCGFSFTGNVGKAHSNGVEAELSVHPITAFSFGGALGYTNAKIDSTVVGVDAEKGDRILFAPKWTINLFADYTTPLTSKFDFFVRGDLQYRSSQWMSFAEFICRAAPGAIADPTRPDCTGADEVPIRNPAHIQEGYTVANISLGVEDDLWVARAFVRNLLNKHPVLDYLGSGNEQAVTLRPRTYGLNLSRRF